MPFRSSRISLNSLGFDLERWDERRDRSRTRQQSARWIDKLSVTAKRMVDWTEIVFGGSACGELPVPRLPSASATTNQLDHYILGQEIPRTTKCGEFDSTVWHGEKVGINQHAL